MAELGTFPRQALICLGAWALVTVADDLFAWSHRPNYQLVDYVLAVGLVIGAAAISYFSVSRMVETPMTWRRALWFFGTGAALVVPLVLALGVMLLAARLKIQWGVLIAIFLLLASLAPIVMLTGWPVWQATSPRPIGPIAAFAATKGFRWPMIGAAFVTGGLNRALPDVSSTTDFLTACTLAVGNSLVAVVSTIVALSIAVAAYRKMSAVRAPI